jgi:YHYH protein
MCDYTNSGSAPPGPALAANQAHWRCDANARLLSANGLPDHAVGAFPSRGNPNKIAAQNVAAKMTLAPSLTDRITRLGGPRRSIGYILNGSYRIKAQPDTNRANVQSFPMGTFRQDYEYVAGLGDLDERNGRFGAPPEFPQEIYHYYATDSYPYLQRCVKGKL